MLHFMLSKAKKLLNLQVCNFFKFYTLVLSQINAFYFSFLTRSIYPENRNKNNIIFKKNRISEEITNFDLLFRK